MTQWNASSRYSRSASGRSVASRSAQSVGWRASSPPRRRRVGDSSLEVAGQLRSVVGVRRDGVPCQPRDVVAPVEERCLHPLDELRRRPLVVVGAGPERVLECLAHLLAGPLACGLRQPEVVDELDRPGVVTHGVRENEFVHAVGVHAQSEGRTPAEVVCHHVGRLDAERVEERRPLSP